MSARLRRSGPDRHPGDTGQLDRGRFLYLLGRKKELIITAGGYKIHPEIVESELNGCQDIAQAAVFLKPGRRSATLSKVVVAQLSRKRCRRQGAGHARFYRQA